MTEENKAIEMFLVKKESKWEAEEEVELQTLQKSVLKLSRIKFIEDDGHIKRCIALSKNRKSVAFDIEMIPAVIAVLKKITPKEFVPAELRDSY